MLEGLTLERLKNSRYMQYLAAMTATISSAAASMYTVWPSPSLPKLQSADSPIGYPITDEEGSWMVSLFLLAIMPASVIVAWTIERFGRKNSLLMSSVLIFFPWLMVIFAKSIGVLYAARTIAGLGSGVITTSCSIYAGEIAEKDIRGKLGTTYVLLKLTGALIVLSIGPFVSYTALNIICATLPIVFICSFVFMPESPYYLMKVGNKELARKNLIKLSSNNVDQNFIDKQLLEIQDTVDADMKNKSTVWEFFTNPDYRYPIFIMIGIKSLQQLSGNAAIDAYMETIIKISGSGISSEMSSIIFGAVQVPGALTSSFLVDKVGRKPLFIVSALGCAVALVAEGIYFYIQDVAEGDTSNLSWLPTTGITVFNIMGPLGIITLPYVLLGEIFPTNIKGIAVAVFTMYGGGLAFLVSKTFQTLQDLWGIHVMFWIYGAACLLGSVFVMIFLPETKGKTFADIQDIMRRGHKKNDNKNVS